MAVRYGDIEPSREFTQQVTDQQEAAERNRRVALENIAVAAHRILESDDGKLLLSYLDDFTDRPVVFEMLPHGAVHKEGQRWLLREIKNQAAQGNAILSKGFNPGPA
jgi:hypothetical protein